MAKGIVNFEIKVNSKTGRREIKLFGDQLKKAEKEQTNWVKAGALASLGAKGLNAALSTLRAGFNALVGPIKDSVFEIGTLGDRIAKQARMIGVTAEEFQVLEFAATRSGTSVTAVANGMKKLGRVMVDARNGSRQIKDTFEALGIELMKNDGTLRNSFDVFKDLADKSMILGESAERTGVQMLLLGRSGTELSNLMSNGAAGIEEMKGELEGLGAIMDDAKTSMGEEFVDRMADLEFAFRGVKIELGDSLLPEFVNFVEEFNKWLSTADFSRVRELADDFFDIAMGAARATDEILNLKLFAPGEEERLQTISNRTEDITERISKGTATLADFRRAFDEVSAATALNQGEMNMWGKRLKEQNIEIGDLVTNLEDLGFGAVPAANAELLIMKDRFQLNQKQIDGFLGLLDAGTDVEAAVGHMTHLNEVTDEQGLMLAFLYDSMSANVEVNKKLVGIRQERIEVGKRELALEERRKKLIDDNRTALQERIANLGADRLAKAAGDKATKDLEKSEKDLARQWAEFTRLVEERQRAWQAYKEEFVFEDREQLMADFEAGLISQFEFTMKMEKATTEAVLEERRRRHEELKAIEAAGGATQEQLSIAREQILRDSEESRRAMSQETFDFMDQLEQQRLSSQMEYASQMLTASSQFFGVLAGIAETAAKNGDRRAAVAAKSLFMIQQSLALGSAIVSTANSVSNALANPPGVPYTIPMGVLAGALGAAQIATIVGTTISGVADAGLTAETLRAAGLNQHSAIAVRKDEMILDPVGTKHITEMLAIQKAAMEGGGGEQVIRTVVELDGEVLGESVDRRLIRQQERGLAYTNSVRQQYEVI